MAKEIMIYVKWDANDISNISKYGMASLITEINENGSVQREIGIDENKRIIHKYPSVDYPQGERGYFNLQTISTEGLKSNTTQDTFDRLWGK